MGQHSPRSFPAVSLVSVTKSDATVYNPPLRSLYVGSGGDVAILAVDDTDPVTVPSVPSGSVLNIAIKKVMATNTTASAMVGYR